MKLERHPANPIVIPGGPTWRQVVTFNPGVALDDDGTFCMLERACSNLAPLHCQFGLLKSDDGVHFEHVVEEPVFTAEQLGTPRGTVEDPRMVKVDGTWYMTYVHRNYASSCFPRGVGIPNYHNPTEVPADDPNNYRSGIATSTDLVTWTDRGLVTPAEVDDRDCVLFPRKIGGRWAMLRRPIHYVGPQYGTDRPSIWITFSQDLVTWTAPELVCKPSGEAWEAVKVGAAAQPIETEDGWLEFYHGVASDGIYRTGILLLDRDDPRQVLARTRDFIMEPELYYEKVGLIIPNVVFPSANVVRDGLIYIYYGCCDTAIALATVSLDQVLEHMRSQRR